MSRGAISPFSCFAFFLGFLFVSVIFILGLARLGSLSTDVSEQMDQYNQLVNDWPDARARLLGDSHNYSFALFGDVPQQVLPFAPPVLNETGVDTYSALRLRTVLRIDLDFPVQPYQNMSQPLRYTFTSGGTSHDMQLPLFKFIINPIPLAGHSGQIAGGCLPNGGAYWPATDSCVLCHILDRVQWVVDGFSLQFPLATYRPFPLRFNSSHPITSTDAQFVIVSIADPGLLLEELKPDNYGYAAFHPAPKIFSFELYDSFYKQEDTGIVFAGVMGIAYTALGALIWLGVRQARIASKLCTFYRGGAGVLPFVLSILLVIASMAILTAFGSVEDGAPGMCQPFQKCDHWGWLHGPFFSPNMFAGVILSVILIPVSLLWFVQSVTMMMQRPTVKKPFVLIVSILLCIFVVGISTAFMVIIPVVQGQKNALSPVFGLWIIFCYGGYGASLIHLLIHQLQQSPHENVIQADSQSSALENFSGSVNESLALGEDVPLIMSRPIHQKTNTFMVALVVLVLLPSIWLSTAFLPPLWNIELIPYFTTHSPFAVGGFVKVANIMGSTCVPDTNRGADASPCWGASTCDLSFKTYPDVLLYYGFIYLMVVIGLLTRLRSFRKIFSKRFLLFGAQTFLGEFLLITLFVGFLISWGAYWASYCRYALGGDSKTTIEYVARVSAQFASIFLTFLMWPATRNGLIQQTFGMSFERAIKYHRWLGVGFYLSTAIHLGLWWTRWLIDSQFWWNLTSTQNSVHPGNWSILLNHICFVIAILPQAILTIDVVRRKRFEWFFFSHHLFLVIILMSLIHAWSLWYYITPPLVLYGFERFLRLNKQTRFGVDRGKLEAQGSYVKVEVCKPMKFTPGQYSFVCAPELSPYQWHPFSMTSDGSKNQSVTFLIKPMGDGTWSEQLASMRDPLLSIDGPYGSPPELSEYSSVLLVAGGVGATPCLSLLKAYSGSITSVELLWVSKEISAFTQVLPDALRSIDGRATVHKFCTGEFEDVPNVERGRPDLAAFASGLHRPALIFACGPEALIDAASAVALHHKIDFHAETFLL